ncbi:MAG TPA: glycosyl hydrolase family 18 protein [Polyangiaceae bacterium]|jgi:hypothetical protein
MKIRSALCSTLALCSVSLLAACGSSSGGDDSGSSAGTSSGDSATSSAGSGNTSAGTSSSGAGTSNGGSTSAGGTGGAGGSAIGSGGSSAAGSGGAPNAGAGGTATGGADGSAGSGGSSNTMIPNTKVVMYLPNWNGSFSSWATKIDFTKMTHLNLAFGVIKNTNDWDLGASDDDVKTLAAAAHAKNVKILVSIGGADDDIGIINAYGNESNIDPMVANMDSFISRLNLDGVDVDLERGAQMESSSNFPEFVSKLEAKLHPEGKLVTTALAQYIVEDMGTDQMTISVVNSYDFINLMIYNTNMGTYTSELSWWKSKINPPATKLVWGIEFTGKLTTDVAKQLTTASKADGGVMVWEYSQPTETTLWPAVQSVL